MSEGPITERLDAAIDRLRRHGQDHLAQGLDRVDEADLEACLGADPKGRVAKACSATSGKLASKVLPKACAGMALDGVFPGCAAPGAPATASCVEASARCRICIALRSADNLLGVDCDLFDDADSNGSCNPPT